MHGFNIIIQSIDNSAVSQTRLLFLGTRLCKNTALHSTHSIAIIQYLEPQIPLTLPRVLLHTTH